MHFSCQKTCCFIFLYYFSAKILKMSLIENYRKEFFTFLQQNLTKKEPQQLYDPIHYILNSKGKRVRPTLTLLSCHIFGEDHKKALWAALALEIFHNFSLVHDDIMDSAPIRRGRATVHSKWDLNTGILSGDAMLIVAYQYFEHYPPAIFAELAQLFSKTALQVCEGQRYDMDFETQSTVSISEYLKMIELKTAVLLGAALQMGAIVAETSAENKKRIYDFGVALGVAFQLQDDYLDTFGDEASFGKKIGGDILENKKTILYIKALELASEQQKEKLLSLYQNKNANEKEKIRTVTQLFQQTQSDQFLRQQVRKYTQKAFDILEKLEIPQEMKQILSDFGTDLMNRKI